MPQRDLDVIFHSFDAESLFRGYLPVGHTVEPAHVEGVPGGVRQGVECLPN